MRVEPHFFGIRAIMNRPLTLAKSSQLSAEHQPTLGHIASFSNIEHEVMPILYGHRITLTYNLYFDDDGPASANDTVLAGWPLGYLSPPLA